MPLIGVDELAARLHHPNLRIADVRWYLNRPGAGRAAYDEVHIPGAIFLDLDADLAAPQGPGRHPLPDPAEFARRLGELGIGSDHDVVAYDDVGGAVAARLWWMLDNLGHRSVRVLDGGIGAWLAAGKPVSTEASVHPPATLSLKDRWSRTTRREALVPRLGEITLLDARAPERYRGETEPIDRVPGHIPTAVNAPTAGNLGPDGRFLPPGELRRRFGELGANSGEVVTSCGSGTNACHHALAMRLAGLDDPILYVGSYSDWSSSGMPVATGEEPGRLPT